jgi:glycosyltransferase involved in cell wall biosynthesis
MGEESDPIHSGPPIVSVVVPAHNEESVIDASVRALLATTATGEFDIIVVPNACSDRTTEIARRLDVRVVETPEPGKAHALELGDDACRTFPRLYLDADVRMSADSVRALVAACARPGVLACAPVPRLDLNGVGGVVKRVHRVHDRMVAPTRALSGVGAYMLTEEGHGRVFPMPSGVISDDGWAHASFAPHERVVVFEAESVVRPARDMSAHLRRRVRVRSGNRQLAELGRVAPEGRLGLRSLISLVTSRNVSPVDAACYLAALALDRVVSRFRRRGQTTWASDASSRVPAPTGD